MDDSSYHVNAMKGRVNFTAANRNEAVPGGRTVKGVGLGPLDSWDGGFESRQEHGCLSLLIVV